MHVVITHLVFAQNLAVAASFGYLGDEMVHGTVKLARGWLYFGLDGTPLLNCPLTNNQIVLQPFDALVGYLRLGVLCLRSRRVRLQGGQLGVIAVMLLLSSRNLLLQIGLLR